MAEVLGQAVLELTTDQTQLDKGLKGLGSSITGAGAALTGLTAPLDAIGVSAIKMGMDFEDSLNHIVGLVGISREQVNAWKEDIYALGKETAKSPKELAEALYFITSSGVDAADALDVLRVSAQASTAGLGETQIVADAVTSAMNAYGEENLSAAQATSVLVAMVRVGKGEAASFAPVLGQIIPIAAALGVSFEQVGAAMAFFTRYGMPAGEAATSLRQILQSMVKPARQEAEALAEVGLSFQQLQTSLKEKGLLATLQMLNERVGGNTEALAKIFPRVQGLTGLLALLGENAGMAEEVFADLADTTESELSAALTAVTEGPGFKMRQAFVELQIELVKFGDMILPIVAGLIVPAAGKAADAFGALAAAFKALPEPLQKVIVVAAGFVAALGPALMMVGLLITTFAMLGPAAGPAAAAMLGFTTGLLSIAAPAAVVIALAAILGTNMKDLAIVVGVAAAAWVAYRTAVAAMTFVSFLSSVASITAGFGTMNVAMATGQAALMSLKAAAMTLPGALMAITIGFIALDAIAKTFLGHGLIDMFTGSGHAAEVAAEYLKKFGSAADYVSVAMENGATEVDANAAALDHYGRLLDGAIRQAIRMRDEGVDDVRQWEAVSEAINGHKEQILALTPSYEELLALIEKYPPLLDVLGGDLDALKAQWQAVQMDKIKDDWHELAGKINAVGLALTGHKGDVERAAGEWQAFLTDIETAGKAMDNLASVVLAKMGLSLRQLELEKRKNELEALGKAAPSGELEAVNAELDAMSRFTQDVTLRVKILGQRLFDALGPNAAGEIDRITKQIYTMLDTVPPEIAFQVLPLLDVLAATQITRFLDMWAAGVTIPIAFAVAKGNLPSFAINLPGPFGEIVNKLVSGVGQLAMATVPATKGVSDFQGAVSGAGSAAEKAKEVVDILADGTITLAEATANGVPAWAAARFEMEATTAELTTGEKAWRNQVDLLKLLFACIDAGVNPALLGFTVLMAAAKGDVEALNSSLGKMLSDGVISLDEAITANLTPAMQAQVEETNAQTLASKAAAEAANRSQVDLIRLAEAMKGTVVESFHTATVSVKTDMATLMSYLTHGLMAMGEKGEISQAAYQVGVQVVNALSTAMTQGGDALALKVADLEGQLVRAWGAGAIDQAGFEMGSSIVEAVRKGLEGGTQTITTTTQEVVGAVTLGTVQFWAAAKMANEGTLNLVETLKLGLAPAQGAAIQALSDEIEAHEELRDTIFGLMSQMDLFLLLLQDLSPTAAASVRELYNLGIELGDEGLGRKALDFELAMQEVDRSFGETRRGAQQLAYAIGTELLSELQGALQTLLGGPSVETAQLQLRIDTLEYQRAVALAAGATDEQVQAIDAEIEALRNRLAVYDAERRIVQGLATLADKTLPTERELLKQALELTLAIGLQSGEVDRLRTATYLQGISAGYAKDQTQKLGDVSKGAADYVFWSSGRVGEAHEVVIGADYRLAAAFDYATGIIGSITAPAYQSGGLASGFSLVGEQGPELIWAAPNTRVFSHQETEALFSRFRPPAVGGIVITGPMVEFSGPVTVRENADIDRIVDRVNRAFYETTRELERAKGI